ncbi:MAG: sterol desaturase family protein [Spirochaetia bacterium]
MSEQAKRNEPIRLFDSDFLEFFSHIHPAVILAVWLPILFVFGYFSGRFWPADVHPLLIIPLGAGGLFFWTLIEYLLHRFIFHFHPKTERGKRISFLFHGVHHTQPMEKTRLVMPPAVSIPLGALFFLVFYIVFGLIFSAMYLMFPVGSGFVLGYIIYDMTHYSLHHIKIKKGYMFRVRKNHMIHHGSTPDKRFGVTGNFWDRIFRTLP